MSDWRTTTLGDICAFKYGKMPKKSQLTDTGYPVFSGYRVVGYSDEYHYRTPVIVIVARGVGGTGDIKMSPPNCFLTNLSIAAPIVESSVDQKFLFYRLLSTTLWELRTGSAQAQITIEHLNRYEVALPPLAIQKKITSILSAYDDLIENNERRIKILEEMAQNLYREWFVNFRFPGHEKVKMVDSPLGKIPEGWEPCVLGDLCDEVRRSIHPSAVDAETPYVGLEHIPRRSITLTTWGSLAGVQSTKLQFHEGEILFGKIRPYFHKVVVAPVSGVCSTDAIVIVPKDPKYHAPVLCCVSSVDFVDHATQTSQGTKMPRANWSVLLRYPLPLPPEDLLDDFSSFVADIVGKLKVLVQKNHSLRNARGLLLPKLISGQLDVSELEIELSEDK